MLDGESTQNFIQTWVVRFLQLQVELAASFSMVVGSGQCLSCEGVCRQVPVTIQVSTLYLDFYYVLPLHGSGLVLGISWLAILGQTVADYVARL